jgi:hypothetical protein
VTFRELLELQKPSGSLVSCPVNCTRSEGMKHQVLGCCCTVAPVKSSAPIGGPNEEEMVPMVVPNWFG